MNYATVSDFILRVGELDAIELTDRDRTGSVDTTVLNVALLDSSSQIDGYLSARYELPLLDIPHNLVRICCALTRYRLASMSQVGNTDEIIERYKLSLKELEAIAKGQISLGIANSKTEDDGDNGVMFTNPKNRVFSRDNENRTSTC